MDHFAGLDVSVKETSVCIVDDVGKIIREVKVASEPEALLAVLKNPAYHFKRIGLEAGPLSQWLYSALAEAELPVVCVETRHGLHKGARIVHACGFVSSVCCVVCDTSVISVPPWPSAAATKLVAI